MVIVTLIGLKARPYAILRNCSCSIKDLDAEKEYNNSKRNLILKYLHTYAPFRHLGLGKVPKYFYKSSKWTNLY